MESIWSAALERENPAECDRRREERDRENMNSIFEILMHAGRAEEVEERGAQCIMRRPRAIQAYSSIMRGWLKLSVSEP